MMDNMTAGQELLRQKEERLKVMENALLGGLVSTTFVCKPSGPIPIFHPSSTFAFFWDLHTNLQACISANGPRNSELEYFPSCNPL